MTEPPPPSTGSRPRPEAQFFAWVLIVIGALLVVLCGGCTLTFWGVGLFSLLQSPGGSEMGAAVGLFFMTLLIGGVPAAGGAILIWAGWRTLHPLKTPRTTAKTFE
jgi:hypothetical protein